MTAAPAFPPLLHGSHVPRDPFAGACARAAEGVDSGLVAYDVTRECLRAAMVFAPEVALRDAVVMLPLCGVAFQNAFGALAPPEVAVHLDWDGGLRLNGAVAGRLRMAVGHDHGGRPPGGTFEEDAVPPWLVVGLDLTLFDPATDPGATPDCTTLADEGCADLDPVHLLESWARHTLLWTRRWEDEGLRPLHAEWIGLAHGLGETFTGVDERFGRLARECGATRLTPLTTLLERP